MATRRICRRGNSIFMPVNKAQLILAPHELEPNRRWDLDSEPFRFRGRWFGRNRKFVAQLSGRERHRLLFFALEDEPERGNFVVAKHNVECLDKDPKYLVCEPKVFAHPLDVRREELLGALNMNWGRVFYLNAELAPANGVDACWRLFLAATGWGQWSAIPAHAEKNAVFGWRAFPTQELTGLPSLELLTWLKRDLLDPQGAFALSRQFASLDGAGRSALVRPLTRGTYVEWQHVVRLFVLSREPLQGFNKPLFFQFQSGDDQGQFCRIRLLSHEIPSFADLDVPDFKRFARWTFDFFAPQLDTHLLTCCFEAKRWSERPNSWTVGLAVPTRHEQLEALLQLRDWLADKATPDEIEALLREE